MNRNLLHCLALLAWLSLPAAAQQARRGAWTLTLQPGGTVAVAHHGHALAPALHAECAIGDRTVSTTDYATHRLTAVSRSADGLLCTVTHTDAALPTLTQRFYCQGDSSLITDLCLSAPAGQQVCTNSLAPIVVESFTGRFLTPDTRALFVPFDNDAWVRFASKTLPTQPTDTLRAYEVTAIYDPQSRQGLVVGAIDHQQWKNAVELTAAGLRAWSGVADALTRDRLPHPAVSGAQVCSARFLLAVATDWREGMERFAATCATVTPRRPWQQPMPVGWNSWGALAFNVNYDNATSVSNFLATDLQSHSFATTDGQLYTGLDSGWNFFSEEQLRDFAAHCRQLNQVPCIYWTPFTHWGQPDSAEPTTLLLANGQPQELDGGYALDPTHPAVKRKMEETHDLFRRLGFSYVKMDFMTHGRLEADRWYRPDIHTGTEAYNYGMHLLDSIFSDMYLNLSISPIFPAQYAQSRRIACDAWNKMKDTEYTMNALSFGWWVGGVYQYNDADHVVLRDATEGENRARITSSVITGLYITGDDFSADSLAISRAQRFLTNPDINALATGRSFRPLLGADEQAEHVFLRTEDNGDLVVAVFNYSPDQPLAFRFNRQQLGLRATAPYQAQELWSHTPVSILHTQVIPPCDVKVFRLHPSL